MGTEPTLQPATALPGAVTDPTLFLWLFVHRHFPGDAVDDPRLLLLREADSFADTLGVEGSGQSDGTWPDGRGEDLDLVELHRSDEDYRPLVSRIAQDEGWIRGYLAYSYLDALAIQIVVGRFGGSGSLRAGWDELLRELRRGFRGEVLEAARQRAIGASAVYWAMAEDGGPPGTTADEVAAILEVDDPHRADTDLGPLWRSEARLFADAPSVPQDAWVLITGDTEETEREVNERYNFVQPRGPCDFARVALSRHKVAFEEEQYERAHAELERRQGSLDRRALWIVATQEYHGETLRDLRSPESIEFQGKLSRAHTALAGYRHTATDVAELRRTVQINRTNFLVGSVALLSEEGRRRVESAPQQDEAALASLGDFAGRGREEGVFGRELGRMQGLLDQLLADLDYSDRVVERHAASLESGGEQLALGSGRDRGGGLEGAAAVAAITALVVVELLRTAGTLAGDPLLATHLLLLSVSATFALVEGLSARRVKPGLQRLAFAAAAGFLAASLVAIPAGRGWAGALLTLPPFLVGAAAGWVVHRRLEFRARRRRRWARRREVEDVEIEKLIYAYEELPDLLEDLPPSTTHRLKDAGSLRRKITTKNEERAAKLGITVEELHRRGEAYDETNITDAIGIRYVVGPHQIPERVDRIREVATVDEPIDYKNVTAELSGGKYDGFRMKYKSVHMDLDLWGVGARKDVNLIAEVQVRTRIQNWFAVWFHDIMYKAQPPPTVDEPRGWRSAVLRALLLRRIVVASRRASAIGGPAPWLVRFFDQWHPWLNRPLARLAIWLGDWQLRRYRRAMEWPDDEPDGSGDRSGSENARP